MLRQYELVERVLAYDPDADEAMLNRAYVYTVQKHGSQKRASGDPYFSHPVEVAGLMTELKLDQATIVTALLHDTVEDTLATIDEVEETEFLNKKVRRIGIFLSVLDVHVNRSPCDGRVEKTHYSAGEFLAARHLEVDLRNENQTWLLTSPRGPILVRQIAGLIARRIVAWKKPQDLVRRGERIGMIRFGSRTDLYVPAVCTIRVQVGQRVKGGETVLATWPA